jgi:ribosomal protein S18 acetylase RimI-like enzyme
MIPAAPVVTIHPLEEEQSAALVRLIGPEVAVTPYTMPLDEATVRREILTDAPPTVFPVRWQRHLRLGAWRGGTLIGFLDAATGHDTESLDLPEYQPVGLIRFLALPERGDLASEVGAALLDAAQGFWEQTGVGFVKAFHLSTGYPCFQAGAGLLPGDWGLQVRALTAAGFHLRERYYCLYRALGEPQEEVTPAADLSLVYRGTRHDRRYEVYHRRVEWVARARLVRAPLVMGEAARQAQVEPVAYLPDIYVDPKWRRQDVGKWLLRRLINDALMQGYGQMVLHLAHHHHAAMNLFVQQGFQELSYRGYSLDKVLTH